jgi:uncharacterized repeat protein (TIGR02543 family)
LARYYTLNHTGVATFDSVAATFNFVPSDVIGGADPTKYLVRKVDTLSVWSAPRTTSALATSTTASGITSFSSFAIGEDTLFTLTVDANPLAGGSVVKDPDQASYGPGALVHLTAMPAMGYHFENWSGNLSGTNAVDSVTMDADKNITANFAPDAPPTVDVTIAINSGWNLVSVPSVPSTYNAYALFSGAVPGTIYSFFTASYVGAPVLVNGQGYWALYAGAGSETINGAPITTTSEVLATGPRWVLVGSITNAVPASKLTSVPSTAIVPGTLYGYNGASYVAPTTLVPGKGYWVLINAPCTLTISE